MFWIGLVVGLFIGGSVGAVAMAVMITAGRRYDDAELDRIEALPGGNGPGDLQSPRAGRVRVADKLG